jgi:mannose-1-phosphate guanylyltransferase/phosphomannomutase
MAGGKATRLKNELNGLPKSLVKIGKKTILDYQIENILRSKPKKIHFCLGVEHDKILKFLNLHYKKLNYTYSIEKQPRGTYGALLDSYDYLEENLFVLFGDILTNYDIDEGFNKFNKSKSEIMLITRYTDHPEDSDLVNSDNKGKVLSIEKKGRSSCNSLLGNSGLIYMKKNIIKNISKKNKEIDLMNDFIKTNLESLKVYSSLSVDFIKDIGTTQRLKEQRKIIKNFSTEKKVCFIDRDGTLIQNQGNTNLINKIIFKPHAIELLKFLQSNFYKIILITNQPGVAKGFFSISQLETFHNTLQLKLIEEGAKPLNAIFYCPHHPESGYPGENKAYKIKCDCRKPRLGMINSAIEKFNLKESKFIFIGDSKSDFNTGKKINASIFIVKSELTEEKYFNKKNVKVFNNLKEIKESIIV